MARIRHDLSATVAAIGVITAVGAPRASHGGRPGLFGFIDSPPIIHSSPLTPGRAWGRHQWK